MSYLCTVNVLLIGHLKDSVFEMEAFHCLSLEFIFGNQKPCQLVSTFSAFHWVVIHIPECTDQLKSSTITQTGSGDHTVSYRMGSWVLSLVGAWWWRCKAARV